MVYASETLGPPPVFRAWLMTASVSALNHSPVMLAHEHRSDFTNVLYVVTSDSFCLETIPKIIGTSLWGLGKG